MVPKHRNGSQISFEKESIGDAIRHNVEAVAKLEEDIKQNRTLTDRVADTIGGFSGTFAFVVIHVFFFAGWILTNLGYIPGIRTFDRFPFLLLSLIVSLEAIFLSTFVLMKQNRMSRRADQRAHLDLQINLLAEKEMTLVIQMLQAISDRLGVRLPHKDLTELSADTSVEALASELQEKLPDRQC